MRFRGVHHVEFSVPEYDESIKFYDKMFGWLGYSSFWTLDVGYRSTYYIAGLPIPHSYIGIQPARAGKILDHREKAAGIHHIALWARSRREVNRFYKEFLLSEKLKVTDKPEEYSVYAPGYYAVFFVDPVGIRWELAYTPRLPMPWHIYRWLRESLQKAGELKRRHPEWNRHPVFYMWRKLPSKEHKASKAIGDS